MVKAKTQSFIALAYFLIASSLGILLRIFPVVNVNADYKYLVHTHSHIALLGWVYVGLTTIIFHLFIKEKAKKRYLKLFLSTQVTILGMLISFPITGYALFSIIFSTLFILCSYWFYAFFRKHNNLKKENYALKFINASLLFMIISSIGPWALGGIMNTLGSTSHWYKNAIYFYLHFQYNGWFVFCLLGVFFAILEKNSIVISKKTFTHFFRLMFTSCIFTLFLSFLWTKPSIIIYFIALLGVVMQSISFIYFYRIIKPQKEFLKNIISPYFYKLITFIFILFALKIVMQTITVIPYFANLAYYMKDFVIGYLHMVFLGITSLSLFFYLHHYKLLKVSKKWIFIYLIGFIHSETLIFYKGFCNWQQLSIINNYYTILVLVSALIPISVLGIFIINLKPTFFTVKNNLK